MSTISFYTTILRDLLLATWRCIVPFLESIYVHFPVHFIQNLQKDMQMIIALVMIMVQLLLLSMLGESFVQSPMPFNFNFSLCFSRLCLNSSLQLQKLQFRFQSLDF
jgi:hypothetical protein